MIDLLIEGLTLSILSKMVGIGITSQKRIIAAPKRDYNPSQGSQPTKLPKHRKGLKIKVIENDYEQ